MPAAKPVVTRRARSPVSRRQRFAPRAGARQDPSNPDALLSADAPRGRAPSSPSGFTAAITRFENQIERTRRTVTGDENTPEP